MRHIGLIVFFAASLAVQNLAAITATKEYVDRKDAATLQVVDQHIKGATNPHKVTAEQVGAYTKKETDSQISNAIGNIQFPVPYVPTKVSELDNDAGYVTDSVTNGLISKEYVERKDAVTYTNAVAAANSYTDNAVASAKPSDYDTVKAAAEAAQEGVDAVRSILAGEDFRITITNYDSKVHAPELSMEARYADSTTQKWAVVWTETNGLARTKRETLAEVRSNHYDKAESDARYKAWGQNDGYTGDAAPDGFAQFSGPGGVIIGGDAGWKNIISASGGSYWIWRGNGNISTSQETGSLEFYDADGGVAFRIVKGDKTLEGANAASISKSSDGGNDIITIVYNVKAEEAPIIEYSASLRPAVWISPSEETFPGTVTWANENKQVWTATVVVPSNGTGFFRATYWKGQESYVKYDKPMSVSNMIIDGVKLKLKVVEINGVKVLGVE